MSRVGGLFVTGILQQFMVYSSVFWDANGGWCITAFMQINTYVGRFVSTQDIYKSTLCFRQEWTDL